MPIKPFAIGHDPAALGLALQIEDRKARQRAIDAVPLTGRRKLVNPSSGWKAFPTTAPGIGLPPEDESLQTAEELAEIAGVLGFLDTPLDPGGFAKHPDCQRLTDTLLALGGTCLVEPRPGGLFRLNAHRMGGRTPSFFMMGYPTGWGPRGSYQPLERMGFYGSTRSEYEALQAGNIPTPQAFGPAMALFNGFRCWASLVDQDPPITIPELIGRELVSKLGQPGGTSPSARFPLSRTEAAFVDDGGMVWMQGSIGQASHSAMQEAWQLKWLYRRQRPMELWRRAVSGELHPDFLKHAGWLVERIGGFLPSVYAPASPMHPDWPSGHAVLAGVGFTLLKAAFADQPYNGAGSLHRELDLAAWVMAFGRTAAGIHTRSSLIAGLMLGQHHAIQLLNRQTEESTRPLGDTMLRSFTGELITIRGTD